VGAESKNSDFKTLMGSLNVARFNEVCEERLAMSRCCNVTCPNEVGTAMLAKAKNLKFVLDKVEGCVLVDKEHTVCFCDGHLASSTKCAKAYKAFKYQVENDNDGGPFGTPMRALVELLSRFKDHPKMLELDRTKILRALEEFEVEINKVSGPIQEKFESVQKRVVKPGVGNPSDGSFEEATQKVV